MQTQHLTAGFIGLGLIGGSIARALKKQAPSTTVMAYMRSRDRLLKAQEDGARRHYFRRRGRAAQTVRHYFSLHAG